MWLDRLEATKIYQHIRFSMNRGLVAYFKRKVLKDKGSFRIAEIACGSGYAAHLLASEENVSLSVGADISLRDHREADIAGYRASFILMDIFRPGLKYASMDLVWNSSSIEEMEEPRKAVAAMAGLAKPGGYVFVGVPYKLGAAGFLRRFFGSAARKWLGRTYDRMELRELLNSVGLTVEEELFYLGYTFIGMLACKTSS